MREDHQPWGEPDRPDRSKEEMRAACGATVAFVLATGPRHDGACDDIRHAVEQVRWAQMPAVYVLAGPEQVADALEAVRLIGAGRRSRTFIEAVEYDPAAAVPLTRDAGDFELIGLPFGLLETTRVIADSLLDTYESVLIMDAAQNRITADHLYELCCDAREHADAEAVVSWIQWLRRTPCLVKRSLLDRLEARDPDLLGGVLDSGARRVPRLRLRDHVFGEEKLAVTRPAPEKAQAFLDKCTMTALQAVALAKYAQNHPEEELHSPNQEPSLLEPAKPKPLNNADALLVRTASAMLETSHGLTVEEAEALAWADSFGRANKRDFPLLCDRAHAGKLAYLDSAATTQRLDLALQAQRDFDVHENANIYRGTYDLSAQATFAFNEARGKLEGFIGASRRQVAFTMNASGAMNLVALAWGERNIGAGDTIVCALSDHHSATLPFMMLAERKGAHVEFIPFDETGRLDVQAYERALEGAPKLVVLTHIGNVFGIEAPIAQLASAAHAAGARVLLDAAQSFPHVKLDVRALGVDWVAISAHKAYGPMGIGALWMSDDAFDEMDPVGGGGGVVSHVSAESYYLRPRSLQYEAGTPPISQAIGWAAAIGYLEDLGMENVARHSAVLTRYAVRGLSRIDGVNVIGDHARADGQTGLIPFTVRSVAPAEVGKFLGRLGVAIRSGGHCALPLHAALGMIGTGRISIGVHTTRDDIDAALTAIALCRQAYE